MSKRIIITLNEPRIEALEKLMVDNMMTNCSEYIGSLITQELIRRDNKKPVGRPKKDTEEQMWYPSPDKHSDYPYTYAELEGYYKIRHEEVPKNVKPLTTKELEWWPELLS